MVTDQEFWRAMDDMSTVSRGSLMAFYELFMYYRMTIKQKEWQGGVMLFLL